MIVLVALGLSQLLCQAFADDRANQRQPNIILILADDKYESIEREAFFAEIVQNFRQLLGFSSNAELQAIQYNSAELTTLSYSRRRQSLPA